VHLLQLNSFKYLCKVDELITISCSEYEQLKRENAELRAMIQSLKEEIALLKGGRSSRTGSTAPSQDIGRSNRLSLRTPSVNKSGGQSGHSGHTLSLSDTPDVIINQTAPVCAQCGENLHQAGSESYSRRQVVDLPEVFPSYIEHRSHVKTCPLCGFQNRGIYPDGVKSPIRYGPSVEAITGYLSVYRYMPCQQIKRFFKDCFRLNLSKGTVSHFLESLSDKSTEAYNAIRDRTGQGEVVGADGTGCRVSRKMYRFHVWQNRFLTFIVSSAGRGHQVTEDYFPGGFLHSFYVSDCWPSQLKTPVRAHQLCMAHLLHEVSDFVRNPGSQWSLQMKELLKAAIRLKKKLTLEDYRNPPAEVTRLNDQPDELLKVDCSKFHIREQAFVKRLIKQRAGIFTFLTDPNIPPDNNASERAIRNVKVKTKVSGQFRNKEGKGADQYAGIRSVIDTTIKNGQEVFAALLCLAKCCRNAPE
jgi:transposase